MPKKIRKAVIPVAGLGTRFLPATKAVPKELLPLVDTPVIQYIVEEAVQSGIEDIIFITSEDKIAIEQYFDRDSALECILEQRQKQEEISKIKALSSMANFIYVRQAEPLGFGHAVLLAKEVVGDEPFIVYGGDDIIESDIPASQQLIDVYMRFDGPVMGVIQVERETVNRYGVIDPVETIEEGIFRLKDIIEKPSVEEAPSTYAATARWLLTPDIFEHLEQVKPGNGGEIQLTDAVRALIHTRTGYAKQYEGVYRDCGNKLEYVKAVISFALKHKDIGPDVRNYIDSL
ncbi:MAG: UTP--glucose-1-phosphate uridylyltransferase [Candidatus Kerfeldbacteria bacterium]|nr:UTP--glucose-1-phosphate uridylyltransferase [Candidatus Kerfeldbacteria bacterium]